MGPTDDEMVRASLDLIGEVDHFDQAWDLVLVSYGYRIGARWEAQAKAKQAWRIAEGQDSESG